MPTINQRYRTSKQKAIVGESAAGLFIVETLFKQPTLFDIYIAVDPALWWNDHELVKQAPIYLQKLPEKPVKLWFTASDAKDIFPHATKLAKILEQNTKKQLTWTFLPQANEHHNTIFRASKEKAFKWALW